VVADHIRALSFAIADGIIPSNEGRGYVLRRILRRAVRYGRTLDFTSHSSSMVDVVAKTIGDVFPEVRAKQRTIQETIRREEDRLTKRSIGDRRFSFDAKGTLVPRLSLFFLNRRERYDVVYKQSKLLGAPRGTSPTEPPKFVFDLEQDLTPVFEKSGFSAPQFPGSFAFNLYDTYGFPLDLTELMARERGLIVDTAGFEKLMEEQRSADAPRRRRQYLRFEDQYDSALSLSAMSA